MQKNFKLKLHNALNQLNLTDADSPALIVGGRRRNRKKRRSRNGHNRKRNKKGESIDNTPAETPESPRKIFKDRLEVSKSKQPLVSCLDIEEPVFCVYPEQKLKKSSVSDDSCDLHDDIDEDLAHMENDGCTTKYRMEGNKDLNEIASEDDLSDTDDTNDRKVLPRLHSADSGVFDDEEDWNQQSLMTPEDDDSALSDNEFDGLDHELHTENKDSTEIKGNDSDTNIDGDSNTFEKEKAPVIISADFSEVDPFLEEVERIGVDEKEEVIFDLAELKNNRLKACEEDVSPRPDNDKFQLKSSLNEPTELEDEVPHRIPLDLLSDEEDDVVLFEAGGRKDLSIICNPLYEQSLKEDTDDVSVKSYQQGFKTDFENINLIRLPATDRAAQKEMKESSPLIRKSPNDDIACCVIL